MANFHTRTLALHSSTCRVCGATKQSVNPDHVIEWMEAHDQTKCAVRPVVAIPDREWED